MESDIIRFLEKQNFVIVTTIDKRGRLHNSCKGIVKIGRNGQIHLLDLYEGRTQENLRRNSNISITAVDEHKFEGYSLKGRARIMEIDEIKSRHIRTWEKKISDRITHRIIKNIHGEKGHSRHPEALLPKPKYLISMKVEEIIDLTPHYLKEESR